MIDKKILSALTHNVSEDDLRLALALLKEVKNLSQAKPEFKTLKFYNEGKFCPSVAASYLVQEIQNAK